MSTSIKSFIRYKKGIGQNHPIPNYNKITITHINHEKYNIIQYNIPLNAFALTMTTRLSNLMINQVHMS